MLTEEWFEMDIPPEVFEALNKKMPLYPPDHILISTLSDIKMDHTDLNGSNDSFYRENDPVSNCINFQLDLEVPKLNSPSTSNTISTSCCMNENDCPERIMCPSPVDTPTSTQTPTCLTENLHICDICGLTLATKATLKRHQLIHTRPFKCDLCYKTFTKQEMLQTHRELHYKNEKQGGQVGDQMDIVAVAVEETLKDTTDQDNFSSDVGPPMTRLKSQPVSASVLYECRFCSKAFPCRKQRSSHMRYHTMNKPFECSKCHKLFTRPDHLVRHLLIHSGEKPFKCNRCKSRFNQKAYLEKHVRRVHP